MLFMSEPPRDIYDDKKTRDAEQKGLCTSICFGFKMLFTNKAALWILFATCFRMIQTIIMGAFVSNYFIVYPDHMQQYSYINALAMFFGSLIGNILTAVLCSVFEDYSMAKPLICMLKSLVEVPCMIMIFMQQKSFAVSMTGVCIEIVIAKGWSAPAIFML